MKSTTEMSKAKPAETPALRIHIGRLATTATPPKVTAAKSAIQALTFTLSDRILFQPPPQTICEDVLIFSPNVGGQPQRP
jgi:hypothetical protein